MRNRLFALAMVMLMGAPVQAATPQRELIRRTLKLSDETANMVSELRVSGGIPLTLVFEVPLKDKGIVLADMSGNFFPPQLTEKSVLLVAKSDLPAGRFTTLTVMLQDGTVIPFKLVSAKKEADLQVDVVLALDKRAAPNSLGALRSTVEQLRGQLDECQASAGSAGINKVASLILTQDMEKPQAFTVERRNLRSIDKQSRLLVELHHAYRLFGQTYLVLSVQNRDPSKVWVLDKPEVGLMGGSETTDLKVTTFLAELASLPPDETGKVVVVFNTPAQGTGHRFFVSLLEKNGNRHFKFEDLKL